MLCLVTTQELQSYIETHIPIVKANRLMVLKAEADCISIGGTLADHLNHRDSVFGGSLSSALILAAWARIRFWTDTFDPEAVIVISEQSVKFSLPVLADFTAFSRPVKDEVLEKAMAQLHRFGIARFTVRAAVSHRGGSDVRAEFSGEFVVVSQATKTPPTS